MHKAKLFFTSGKYQIVVDNEIFHSIDKDISLKHFLDINI